ncbi:MAG TPA: iron-containing redox enzyme family protein [Burkholderiaceae bacterium]
MQPNSVTADLKDYVISENKAVVRNDPVVLALMRKQVNARQYRLYAAQRAAVANNFVRLVLKTADAARSRGDADLAAALDANADDELGRGSDGVARAEHNHRNWKLAYLNALGIDTEAPDFPLLDETRAHADAFLELEAEAGMLRMAGALLSLENIIPLEYRAAIQSRDHLFPQLFCITPEDGEEARLGKAAARRYLDDHVVHDANEHFPQLLHALEKYQDDPAAMEEIKSGIDFVNRHRKSFYEGLAGALAFDEARMDYFTYGRA